MRPLTRLKVSVPEPGKPALVPWDPHAGRREPTPVSRVAVCDMAFMDPDTHRSHALCLHSDVFICF